MGQDFRATLSNRILRIFPEEAFDTLRPQLEPVVLPKRLKLAEPTRRCQHIYFLESGIASVVGQVGDQLQEVGIFGHEGLGCVYSLLGSSPIPPYTIVMQVSGNGYRAPLATMSRLFQDDLGVRDIVLRYLQTYLVQLSQSCIANVQYNTVQRMARWFLLIHDRMDGDSFELTHDYIATMLGVGRTGVTLALHALEHAGLISTARKKVNITDRQGLEIMTQSVYGFAERHYERLFDTPVRDERPGPEAKRA